MAAEANVRDQVAVGLHESAPAPGYYDMADERRPPRLISILELTMQVMKINYYLMSIMWIHWIYFN